MLKIQKSSKQALDLSYVTITSIEIIKYPCLKLITNNEYL